MKSDVFVRMFLAIVLIYVLSACGNKEKSFFESTSFAHDEPLLGDECDIGEVVSYGFTYYDTDDLDVNPRYVAQNTQIIPGETALVVIDPWKDNPSQEINQAVESHAKDYLMPVVHHAIENGIHVYIFTNDPHIIEYTTKIIDDLYDLVECNDTVELCYYTEYPDAAVFTNELVQMGVKNLIYIGYSTHLCLLYRPVGICSVYYDMNFPELNMFIIPEATLAFVTQDTKVNTDMRNNVCTMLTQQGIARVITIEDFLCYKGR